VNPNEFEKPVVLIPVMAEDVARQQRRQVTKWVAVGIVVALAALFAYKRIADPRDAREAYDAGLRLLKATRYEQAALNFSRTIDLKPDFVDAYRMRARVYIAQSNSDSAIRDFTKVLELNPRDSHALVERGFAWLDKKSYANAVADATGAISLDAKLGRAYTLRATARRAMGESTKAIEDFTMAMGIEPNLENYFQRASTYQILGKQELAIADFTRALFLDPAEPHLYFARAQAKAASGDAKGAQADIATGRKIDGW
jgi:tetratricopeptide (TPR) repeat protein